MRGYIVDVNHVEAHFRELPVFMDRLKKEPFGDQFRVCAITLGEIEASHLMSVSTDQDRRNAYARFVIEEYVHRAIEITATTRVSYGSIIGTIWQKHPPSSKRIKTEAHLVQCGVDVNDVWLVASALEHGLTVLTQDDMPYIREAVPDVKFDCWI